jgi:hypothetical protein
MYGDGNRFVFLEAVSDADDEDVRRLFDKI